MPTQSRGHGTEIPEVLFAGVLQSLGENRQDSNFIHARSNCFQEMPRDDSRSIPMCRLLLID